MDRFQQLTTTAGFSGLNGQISGGGGNEKMNVTNENRYLQQVQGISKASLCDLLPSRLTNIR